LRDEPHEVGVSELAGYAIGFRECLAGIPEHSPHSQDARSGKLAQGRWIRLRRRCGVELQREVTLVLRFVADAEREPSALVVRCDVRQRSKDEDRVRDTTLCIQPVPSRIERLRGARR